MADRIDIVISAKDRTGPAIQKTSKGLNVVALGARAAGAAVKAMTVALVAVPAALAAIAASSVRAFADFDDRVRAAGAVTNATASQMVELEQAARKMGATTRYTASQAAEGLQLLGMAGFEVGEAISALPEVLNLAAAGNLELSQAADIATNVLAGFGLEVEQLGQVNDVLAKTFTSSNTTLVELGESFKLVGPIAKGVGADFEDLLAAIGKLGDAGLKGTLSGTALRGAINALLNPTREEEKLMKKLAERIGVTSLEVKDAQGNFVGFAKIIEQLEAAGLKGDEALKLFGQRAGPAMAALLQVGSEELVNMREELRRATGTTDEIASRMEEGLGGAIRRSRSAMESLRLTIGKTFAGDAQSIVEAFTERILELNDAIEKLGKGEEIKTFRTAFYGTFRAIWEIIRTVHAALKELLKPLQAIVLVMMGDFTAAGIALKDIGSDFDALLIKQGLLESASERRRDSLQREIDLVEKQAAQVRAKIQQDQEDAEGWRGKLIGAEKYQAQMEKHQAQLERLEEKLKGLNEEQYQVELQIIVDEIKADEYIDSWRNTISEVNKEANAIGTGQDPDAPRAPQPPPQVETVSRETLIQAEVQRQRAIAVESQAILEKRYAEGERTLEQYYDERKAIIRKALQVEIDALVKRADIETNINKRERLDTQVFSKRKQLNAQLINLDKQKLEALARLDEQRQREIDKQNEAIKKKAEEKAAALIQKDKALADQRRRLEILPAGPEGEFRAEQQQLAETHARELQALQDFHAKQAALEDAKGQSDIERLKMLEEQKRQITEQALLQKEERERQSADQATRLFQFQLESMATVAGNAAQIFEGLYEVTGKKSKEAFYIAKAARLAEATMNIAAAVTAALGAPPYGLGAIATAATIGALGAVQIAKIAAQSLATGGLVEGRSPSATADDKLIAATAGEYMQPVDTVKHYGLSAMEAIRKKAVPRELLQGYQVPSIKYGSRAFQQGGAVSNSSGLKDASKREGGKPTNIINVLDPAVFDQWSTSAAGQQNIINAVSENIFEVRQMVFDNQQ